VRQALDAYSAMPAQSAAIRRTISWGLIEVALMKNDHATSRRQTLTGRLAPLWPAISALLGYCME